MTDKEISSEELSCIATPHHTLEFPCYFNLQRPVSSSIPAVEYYLLNKLVPTVHHIFFGDLVQFYFTDFDTYTEMIGCICVGLRLIKNDIEVIVCSKNSQEVYFHRLKKKKTFLSLNFYHVSK